MSVSYSGNIYDEKDLENLWKNIERFKTWAESQLSGLRYNKCHTIIRKIS